MTLRGLNKGCATAKSPVAVGTINLFLLAMLSLVLRILGRGVSWINGLRTSAARVAPLRFGAESDRGLRGTIR